MQQYIDLCNKVFQFGLEKTNRTGINHIGYHGDMMKFDLAEGFPILTTKEVNFKACVAEMLGFLRGYDNAEDFRKLGCKVWDANANENEEWLSNLNRYGTDDLGRIYGVQARDWRANGDTLSTRHIDQLQGVIDDLVQGKDNRREIVTHWNPGEFHLMALPPCHVLYQFGIQGAYLNLSMYQRSCDVPLGIPFNITGYAWLLSAVAHISNLVPGAFTHFMHDIHVYANQVETLKNVQMVREPRELPTLIINPAIRTLQDLETWVRPEDFSLEGYDPHPKIKYPFAV